MDKDHGEPRVAFEESLCRVLGYWREEVGKAGYIAIEEKGNE